MPTRTVATRDPHKPVEPPELAFPHCCCPPEQVKHVTTKSDALMAEAVTIMPGGVSSPVRAFKSVGGNPVVFDHVKGSKAYDVDGNEYVDYVGTWGPAIVGHADDTVLAAITETMQKGTSFGAPCALENELAKMVTSPPLTLTLAPTLTLTLT